MRYFIQFSYDGSDFHGSQTQPNATTIQGVMEQALSTILRQPIALVFAGRTDAGVHALQMWAHFDYLIEDVLPLAQRGKPVQEIRHINSLLPSSIAIEQIVPVEGDAHARFSALDRTYCYYITTHKNPFRLCYSTRVSAGLDFERMNMAAQYLMGRQDFASFCRVHTDVKTTFCTITEAFWQPLSECTNASPCMVHGAWSTDMVFTITADRFLRNMVRAIVGTLLDVGYGKLSPEEFQSIILRCNRCAASQSAPATGLFLTHISYPKNIFLPLCD